MKLYWVEAGTVVDGNMSVLVVARDVPEAVRHWQQMFRSWVWPPTLRLWEAPSPEIVGPGVVAYVSEQTVKLW